MPHKAKGLALHTSLPLPAKIRQIDALQVLRAIAVALVAWLHTGQSLAPVVTRELPHCGAFGIDIFFVISGFIMSTILLRSPQPPGLHAMGEFLKRRLLRIYPIYWFFAGLTALRLLHSHRLFQQNYLPAVFLIPIHYPNIPLIVDFSWTLIFEMFFYLVLSAILLATTRRAVPTAIALFSAAVLLGEIVGIRRPVWIIVCNPMLLEFVFGAALALTYQRLGRRPRTGIALLLLGITAALYLRAYPAQGGATGMQMVLTATEVTRRVMTWGLAAAMIVGGVILWSPTVTTRPGKLAVILGNASYSTYLASSLLIEFTTRALLKLHGGGLLSPGEHLLYQTLIVLAVFTGGWACYQFLEWPMVRSLQARLLQGRL